MHRSFLAGPDMISSSVRDLLPHAPPMVLLDEVTACDQDQTSAVLKINETSPFYIKDVGVPSYVGLEYMAQTCGLFAGIDAQKKEDPIRLGYLLGTRDYHTSLDVFTLNDSLIITVKTVFQQEGMAVFDCCITRNNQEVATAQLTLYQPNETLVETPPT